MAKKRKLGQSFNEARQNDKFKKQVITTAVLGGGFILTGGALAAVFAVGAGYTGYKAVQTATKNPHKAPKNNRK